MSYIKRDKILLINPKLKLASDDTFHCTYSHSVGSTNSADLPIINEPTADYPLGLLYLAGYLENQGHKVQIIDTEKFSKNHSFRQIRNNLMSAIAVCITAMTPQIPYALELSDFIKSINPKVPIVWGGIHPTLFPFETIKDTAIDFVIIGEGEITLDLLITCLKQDDWDRIQQIPNLLFKGNACNITGPGYSGKQNIHHNLATEPLPAYHLLDLEKYVHVRQADCTVRRTVEIITSRGCPYRCTFCINSLINRGKWRAQPVEKVLRDIRTLVNRYSIEHVFFLDECFFINLNRAIKIIQGLKEFNITWEANIRADLLRENLITDDFLRIFRQCGCRLLRIGAESGSQRILNLLKKDITPMDILNAVKRCSQFEISCNLSFMIAIPGETKQDMIKTIELIHKILQVEPRTEIVGPQPYRPYPGSALYDAQYTQKSPDKPYTLRAWHKSSLLANMLYLNVVTSEFDRETVEYLRNLGYIVETDPDRLQKELIRRGDRKGRRFQKQRRV